MSAAASMSEDDLPSRDLLGDRVPPPMSVKRRSKITNDITGAGAFDRRSADGRRRRDLLRGFLEECGNPTGVAAQAACKTAAELTFAAERARADLLAGKGDADTVVRLENASARAIEALERYRLATNQSGVDSVRDYLARHHGDRDELK
jgi:hypothetical protein